MNPTKRRGLRRDVEFHNGKTPDTENVLYSIHYRRAAMYAEMQRLVRDEGGQVIPMFSSVITAHSDRLAHGPVSGNAIMDGLRLPERWWFA